MYAHMRKKNQSQDSKNGVQQHVRWKFGGVNQLNKEPGLSAEYLWNLTRSITAS